jgi:hypothetical protein
MAEHSYPTPTRNHLSMHNREAAKRKLNGRTRASEVRIGIRTPDGNSYMGTTASEDAKRRQDELLDKALERKQRADALKQLVYEQMAETDSWAHKV